MWNDEDNNPYGTSFDRRDSNASSSQNPISPTARNCKAIPRGVGNASETRATIQTVTDMIVYQFKRNARIRLHQAAKMRDQNSAGAEAPKMAKTTENPKKRLFLSASPAAMTVALNKYFTRTRNLQLRSPMLARAWKAAADISSTPSAQE